MKLVQLHGEQRFWNTKLEVLMSKAGLRWEVQVNLQNGTVMLHLIHPNKLAAKNELLTKIDVDRSKRPEEKIMEEIEIAIRRHTDL